MLVTLRWIRLVVSFIALTAMVFIAINYQTAIYLLYQGTGQLQVLLKTQSMANYRSTAQANERQLKNLELVEQIKTYSIDSLAYKPTKNFTTVYNQQNAPILWVITACKPFAFEPYTWQFPVVGRVSYKGFFKKELAEKEYNHLICLGYDVDMRSVSAWSTLGWFNDPLLSSMLLRSKGGLCNLLFHELFHATYYAPNAVDVNENLASFVAHKATIKFLSNDTAELNDYLQNQTDNNLFNNFMLRQTAALQKLYKNIRHNNNGQILKHKALLQITDSINLLPLHNKKRYTSRKAEILASKNAVFIDFQQYDSLQDSLEKVFNKIYRGNIKKMVQDLKLNGIYY
ncbi:MAG: aminopeptidase [Bacteroidia bacterium]|nr:aminopeptidase [Bacteroidia bacterium]